MTITVTKNGERLASYNIKSSKARKALRALKAFYNAAYSTTNANIQYIKERA